MFRDLLSYHQHPELMERTIYMHRVRNNVIAELEYIFSPLIVYFPIYILSNENVLRT